MRTVRIQRVGNDRLFSTGFASVDEVVVKTLRDQDRIKKAKVHGQDNHSRYQASPDGTEEIGDVPEQPDGQERQGNTFGRAALVVFNQLRNL